MNMANFFIFDANLLNFLIVLELHGGAKIRATHPYFLKARKILSPSGVPRVTIRISDI